METNDPLVAADVLAVLEAETRAFWEKDFDAFARCGRLKPMSGAAGGGSGRSKLRRGWDDIAAVTRQQFAENPEMNVSAQAVRRENLIVRVGSDMAWITFDQYAPDAGEADMDMPG